MKREFIQTAEFRKKWDETGLDDIDLADLEDELCENPHKGKIMKKTGGIRKTRWGVGKGKSSGIRVLYLDFSSFEIILLITLFKKNEKDNLSNEEKNILKKYVQLLKKQVEDYYYGEKK